MALIPDDPRQRNALFIGILAAAGFYLFWSLWYSPRNTEVEEMAAEWAKKDPNKTAEQIFIKTTWKDRDGEERERDISLSEARMQFYDLQSYLGQCATCSANVASDRFKGGVYSGFGCYLHVGHPISKELEDALMAGANRAVAQSKIEPSIALLDQLLPT